MPGRNGTAEAAKPVGVLDLEDVAYERDLVRVPINGEPRVFNIWVNGPGCPGRVKAEYARIARRFRLSEDDPAAAYHEFLVDALMKVGEIPASQYELVDLLAGDTARAEKILLHFRWFSAPEQEASDDPEAPGGASTTDGSSPTSAPPSVGLAPTAAAG